MWKRKLKDFRCVYACFSNSNDSLKSIIGIYNLAKCLKYNPLDKYVIEKIISANQIIFVGCIQVKIHAVLMAMLPSYESFEVIHDLGRNPNSKI